MNIVALLAARRSRCFPLESTSGRTRPLLYLTVNVTWLTWQWLKLGKLQEMIVVWGSNKYASKVTFWTWNNSFTIVLMVQCRSHSCDFSVTYITSRYKFLTRNLLWCNEFCLKLAHYIMWCCARKLWGAPNPTKCTFLQRSSVCRISGSWIIFSFVYNPPKLRINMFLLPEIVPSISTESCSMESVVFSMVARNGQT